VPSENGMSSATAVVTDVDDYDAYNITIDKMALSADDSVHVDGCVPFEKLPAHVYNYLTNFVHFLSQLIPFKQFSLPGPVC